jgi:hypothetical protein
MLASLFNIISCLEPIIPSFHLVQALVETHVPSSHPRMEFGQYALYFNLMEDYVSYFRSPTGGSQVCHPLMQGTSTGPSSPSCRTAVSNVFPVLALSSLFSSRSGRMSWSFSCPILRAVGSVLMDTAARTCLTSACASIFWQWVHSSCHGLQDRALVCCVLDPGSAWKLYSWRWWIQQADNWSSYSSWSGEGGVVSTQLNSCPLPSNGWLLYFNSSVMSQYPGKFFN